MVHDPYAVHSAWSMFYSYKIDMNQAGDAFYVTSICVCMHAHLFICNSRVSLILAIHLVISWRLSTRMLIDGVLSFKYMFSRSSRKQTSDAVLFTRTTEQISGVRVR